MKNIKFLYAALLGVLFMGCEPMEDIHDEIDAQEEAVKGEANYTLTEDDYTDLLELDFTSFSSEDEAKQLIPTVLENQYPYWGAGSTVMVNYNLYVGRKDGLSDYTGAMDYELTKADYALTGSDANGFYPEANIEQGIDQVLSAQMPNAQEGDVLLVEYDQYTEDPVVGFADFISYNFANSLEGWTIEDKLGAEGWESRTDYVQGNGFNSGPQANIDWLVSPSIDLTNETDLRFQIDQAINYATDMSLLKILVATDYTNDVDTATWTEINLATTPTGSSNDFILSENYDFSAYEGETINIALKYESTASDAARWRVKTVALKTIGITGESNTYKHFYMFDGSEWVKDDAAYYLQAADYDEMGSPGRYNNFSSSDKPENYLPAFLNKMFPYVQEGDAIFLVYNYYNGDETQTRGDYYYYEMGMWNRHESVQEVSLQFGFEDGTWVPDNTINYTLTEADYLTIESELADKYPDPASSAGRYKNFDLREGNKNFWTNDMLLEAINVVLNDINPDAEEGQKYAVSYAYYNGSSGVDTMYVIKENGAWVLQE